MYMCVYIYEYELTEWKVQFRVEMSKRVNIGTVAFTPGPVLAVSAMPV